MTVRDSCHRGFRACLNGRSALTEAWPSIKTFQDHQAVLYHYCGTNNKKEIGWPLPQETL